MQALSSGAGPGILAICLACLVRAERRTARPLTGPVRSPWSAAPGWSPTLAAANENRNPLRDSDTGEPVKTPAAVSLARRIRLPFLSALRVADLEPLLVYVAVLFDRADELHLRPGG